MTRKQSSGHSYTGAGHFQVQRCNDLAIATSAGTHGSRRAEEDGADCVSSRDPGLALPARQCV